MSSVAKMPTAVTKLMQFATNDTFEWLSSRKRYGETTDSSLKAAVRAPFCNSQRMGSLGTKQEQRSF